MNDRKESQKASQRKLEANTKRFLDIFADNNSVDKSINQEPVQAEHVNFKVIFKNTYRSFGLNLNILCI